MTDFTWSFVRGDSTLQPGTRPLIPETEPVVSILRLDFLENHKQKVSVPVEEDGQEAVDIKANGVSATLQDLIGLIERQPGLEYFLQAREREIMDDNTAFLFVGWERHPSVALSTVDSLIELIQSSATTGSVPLSASQIGLWNVPFTVSLTRNALYYHKAPIELVIWDIPAPLDPQYHHNRAEEFAGLDYPFGLISSWRGRDGPGDLMQCLRGWKMLNEEQEPCERTHVFLLFWKSEEAQGRFKDPEQRTLIHGRGGSAFNEGSGDFWEKNFVALEKKWHSQGMTARSFNLRI